MLGGVLPKSRWQRCRFLHLDFGNTEVLAWDLGKTHVFLLISGCRNLHVALGNSLTYYILPWFFPQWIRDPSFRDLVFFFADLLARRTPNPSPPQIRRITIFYFICDLSIQPKKHIWTTIELVIVCSDWYYHEYSRRVDGWRGKLSIRFLAWQSNGG